MGRFGVLGREGLLVSVGWVIGFLVLVAAFVLWLTDKMPGVEAALFGALAAAILFSPFPVRWPWATPPAS